MSKYHKKIPKEIKIRIATIKDAEKLLEWRNHPQVRFMGHNTDEVKKDQHLKWLQIALNDKNRKLYIVEENGAPVGTIKAELSDGIFNLSWTVAPESWGRGIGRKMISMVVNDLNGNVVAEIKEGNIASVRVAEYAGLSLFKKSDGILYFGKNI